ncbi:hypothetical protein N9Q43_00635 [bacterium]|nr:hypothetical protein [bacterium]
MYFPKSQITTNLSTNGKEFKIIGSNDFYTGFYFSTSNGKYYTGRTPQDGSNELLIRVETKDPQLELTNNISGGTSTLSPKTIQSLNNRSTLPSFLKTKSSISPTPPQGTIVFPTEDDYIDQQYQRYFLKHNLNNIYLETNLQTYNNFSTSNPSVQYQLYTAIKIDWILVGKPIEVYDINRNIALLYEKENNIRGFSNFFKGRYLKYFRPLKNEYYSTKGNELKTQDTNKNYVGYYHVFPTRGVIMEGKFHTASPHQVLIPSIGEEIIEQNVLSNARGEVGTSIRKNIARGSGY